MRVVPSIGSRRHAGRGAAWGVAAVAGGMGPGAAAARARVVWIGAHTLGPVRRSFSDVPSGTPVALVGSGGALEIAVRDASAAATLAAQVGTEVRIPLTSP